MMSTSSERLELAKQFADHVAQMLRLAGPAIEPITHKLEFSRGNLG